MSYVPPPPAFGLPSKFAEWRTSQLQIVTDGIANRAPVMGVCAPVGIGKSLAGVAIGTIRPRRCVVVTATKGLQDQYMSDFAQCGMVDLRGRENYTCPDEIQDNDNDGPAYTCADGPCFGGLRCRAKWSGRCPYENAKRKFLAAPLATTNYSYLIAANRYSDGIGPVGTLVLDEAHDARKQVEAAMSVTITARELDSIMSSVFLPLPPDNKDNAYLIDDAWEKWAAHQLRKITGIISAMEAEAAAKAEAGGTAPPKPTITELLKMRRFTALQQKLVLLTSPGVQWVWDRTGHGAWTTYRFDPLSCAAFAQGYLLNGADTTLLLSATLTYKTPLDLGVDPVGLNYRNYDSPFSVARGPIYILSVCKVDSKMDQTDWDNLLTVIDMIIAGRMDRKGLIHTVSYDRAIGVMKDSKFARIMVGNKPKPRVSRRGGSNANDSNVGNVYSPGESGYGEYHTTTAEIVEQFKITPAPKVLVSPSITTGWDFPMSAAEYQILMKVPFPDASSRIMKARAKADPLYHSQLAAQEIAQAVGRIRRSEGDQGETFILDTHARWFIPGRNNTAHKHRLLFPESIYQYIKYIDVVPTPPQSLLEQVFHGNPNR